MGPLHWTDQIYTQFFVSVNIQKVSGILLEITNRGLAIPTRALLRNASFNCAAFRKQRAFRVQLVNFPDMPRVRRVYGDNK